MLKSSFGKQFTRKECWSTSSTQDLKFSVSQFQRNVCSENFFTPQGCCRAREGAGAGQERTHQPVKEERQQEQAAPGRGRQEAGQGHVLMM